MKDPAFFLSAAAEMSGDLARTRSCWAKARLRDELRDDYMLIDVAPPVVSKENQDVTELLISTRHVGFSLFPLKGLPLDVYIARVRDQRIVGTLTFTKGQVELIGWGRIFRTAEEADLERKKFEK